MGEWQSRLGFFSSGNTCADLNDSGKRPLVKDMLASLAIIGAKTSALDLRRGVGKMSSGEVLGGVARSTDRTSSTEIGWNVCRRLLV